MAKPWSAVESSPEYQNLDATKQDLVKQQYFDEVVKNKPEFQKLGADEQKVAESQFMGTQTPPLSAMQQAGNIAKQGFKFITTPLSKTLTGKSLQDYAIQAVQNNNPKYGQSPNAPFDKNVKNVVAPTFLKTAGAGMAGSAADMATTPSSYIPIPGSRILGKIPIGSTNLGRIASNVAVKPGFLQGVKDLQAMESKLGNVATSASGKAISTSSRGALPLQYNDNADKAILKVYNEAINPSTGKFTNKNKLDNYQNKVLNVFKDIHSNQNNIQLENPVTGTMENRAPVNRGELLSASDQRKQQIYDQYSQITKQASQGKNPVLIDKGKIAKDSFDEIIKNPQYQDYAPDLVKQAKAVQSRLVSKGSATPDQIQKDMEFLNNKMKAYYTKGDYNAANVYATYAGNLRSALNKSIEDTLGNSGYSDLKKLYGSHVTLEKDLTKAAAQQLKKANPLLEDHFSNPIALAEMARGALSGNLVEMGTGAAIKGAAMAKTMMENPDRRVAGLFNFLNKGYYSNPGGVVSAGGRIPIFRPPFKQPTYQEVMPKMFQPSAPRMENGPSQPTVLPPENRVQAGQGPLPQFPVRPNTNYPIVSRPAPNKIVMPHSLPSEGKLFTPGKNYVVNGKDLKFQYSNKGKYYFKSNEGNVVLNLKQVKKMMAKGPTVNKTYPEGNFSILPEGQ